MPFKGTVGSQIKVTCYWSTYCHLPLWTGYCSCVVVCLSFFFLSFFFLPACHLTLHWENPIRRSDQSDVYLRYRLWSWTTDHLLREGETSVWPCRSNRASKEGIGEGQESTLPHRELWPVRSLPRHFTTSSRGLWSASPNCFRKRAFASKGQPPPDVDFGKDSDLVQYWRKHV